MNRTMGAEIAYKQDDDVKHTFVHGITDWNEDEIIDSIIGKLGISRSDIIEINRIYEGVYL